MDNPDTWKFIDMYFRDNPRFKVTHHIDSYDNFMQEGISQIFNEKNPIRFFKGPGKYRVIEGDDVQNYHEDDYQYECEIYLGGENGEQIYVGKPIIYDSNDRQHFMYPNEARLRNMSYGATINYDVTLKFKILLERDDGNFTEHQETMTIEKMYLGRFPIMLQSKLCILNGLAAEARYNMGECRNDMGGYFIIDGKEKVIISQEKFANNMLYIKKDFNDVYSYAAEIKSAAEDVSKPIRTLSVRIVAPQPSSSNNQIVVNIPNIRKPIPLFIVMRALGIISDREIITTCLLDINKYSDYVDEFRPCVHDAGSIFTQQAALKYMASFTKGKTVTQIHDILMNLFLPHIGELNYKRKALFLGYIVFRLLKVKSGEAKPTDRDSFSFKRIETPGMLLHQLFREYYSLQQHNIFLKIDKEWTYANKSKYQNLDFKNLFLENFPLYFSERIVETGFRKAFKGNWGSAEHTKRAGVVQDLNRLSYWGTSAQFRKINLNINADGAKIVAPRLLHGTQWGIICPIHTPDGGNIGFHKHLTVSTMITSGCSGNSYIPYLRNLGMQLLEECSYKYMASVTKVFVNGGWVGVTRNPELFVELIRAHRRNNLINVFISIRWFITNNEILIATDSGRPCHPLFYMTKNGTLSFERESVMEKLNSGELTWNEALTGFLNIKQTNLTVCDIHAQAKYMNPDILASLNASSSVIEYLDTQELESSKIALSTLKRDEYLRNHVTHAEIHHSFLLSIMANQIIFPENNQFPRDLFSCGQSKQAASLYSSNYHNRIDKTGIILNYGQIPLTKSRYLKYTSNEEHPYGENAIVAVMCFSGYNTEDAILINEGSLHRGLFRTTYYNMYESHEESTKFGSSKIDSKFMNIQNNSVVGQKPGYDYGLLDENGLIRENTRMNDKVVMIGKATNSLTQAGTYIDMSKTPKKGQKGYVDKAFMTEGDEGGRIAKVRIREERYPAIGDKFCSRAGQKGTVGLVVPECDMPFTADGVRPDIIVNPHAMPSRMTIGHLVETLTSKSAAIYGGFGNCTAFENQGPKNKILGDMLIKAGYHSTGNEILYNGMTGEQLETEIYFGPTYYLRLKHMVKDKINHRAQGPRTKLTRQTVGGRANDGGLRIGEMDRDCLVAHGLSYFIEESMMVRGDQFYMAVCNQTGCIAVYNQTRNIFLSPMADGPLKFTQNIDNTFNIVNVSRFGRDFSIIRVPYAFKLLMQELKSMNIQMRIITEDNVDQLTSLTRSNNMEILTGKDTFEKIEVENQKRLESTPDAPEILKQAAPEEVEVTENESTFWVNPFATQGPPGDFYEAQIDAVSRMPGMVNDGTFIDETPLFSNKNEKKEVVEYFKRGDFIKYKVDGDNGHIYKIIDFDDDYMMWMTEAVTGPNKGKYRDGDDHEFARVSDLEISKMQQFIKTSSNPSPEYVPESPPFGFNSPPVQGLAPQSPSPQYQPKSPDYSATSPPYVPVSPPTSPTTGAERENKVITVDTGNMPELDLGEPVVTEKTTVKILGDDADKNLSVIAEVDEKNEEENNQSEGDSQTKNVKTD